MASLSIHICVFILCSSLFIPINCHLHGYPQQVALFIFGDSLYDVGNNNYINTTTDAQANFWPYGETFFNYPTGRFSDGRLIPDFIAEYANLPLIPSYLQPGNHQFTHGANFASAGGGGLVETSAGFVIDLKTQLSNFEKVEKLLRKKLGDANAKKVVSGAVYLISIGSNDYISPFFATNSSVLQSYSREEYVQLVIGNFTSVIKEIYEKGGRKFGFLGLGPLGCLPVVKLLVPGSTGDCLEEVTVLANLHNRALSETLKKLESQLKGFMYSILDFNTSAIERMNNPSKYGFKEGKIACCGTGPYGGVPSCGGQRTVKEYELCENVSEYVFFDSSHPTERANQQYAELMWSGTPNVTGPHNLKALFELTQY
ncbi:hypothetical protein L1049_004862 [Liquidambar formosana]|uniref:GDSL esterase/lipase 1-like n=1 Tax=Liquidambar formosana TaxID=63359 RepID=A0AAP0RQE5_LIQFO